MNASHQSTSHIKPGLAAQTAPAATTEADLEMLDENEDQPAMLEMVPIGKIEEVAKQKRRQSSLQRYSSHGGRGGAGGSVQGHYSRYQGNQNVSRAATQYYGNMFDDSITGDRYAPPPYMNRSY